MEGVQKLLQIIVQNLRNPLPLALFGQAESRGQRAYLSCSFVHALFQRLSHMGQALLLGLQLAPGLNPGSDVKGKGHHAFNLVATPDRLQHQIDENLL